MDILDDAFTKPVPSPLSIRPSEGCLRIPGTTPIEERTRFKRRPNRRTHRRSRSLGSLNFRGRKRKANRIGFDAFRVEHMRVCGRGRTVVGTEIVSPHRGIHSLEWADGTAPQDSTLLSLPTELRMRIWRYALAGLILSPHKDGCKFYSRHGIGPRYPTYEALSTICRQIYVEVVGGSLLYTSADFRFDSPGLMHIYLSVINPAHKNNVRSIHLSIDLKARRYNQDGHVFEDAVLEPVDFRRLASCKGLRNLTVHFKIARVLCWKLDLDSQGKQGTKEDTIYLVNDHLLEYIRDFTYWKRIKNLETFCLQLDVVWPGGYSEPILIGAQNLEDDLKKVLLESTGV